MISSSSFNHNLHCSLTLFDSKFKNLMAHKAYAQAPQANNTLFQKSNNMETCPNWSCKWYDKSIMCLLIYKTSLYSYVGY